MSTGALKSLSMGLLILLLAGCGFQLRGEARLPEAMARTWLAVPDANSAFARELALRLQGDGVELTDGPEAGSATLRIHGERLRSEPLTISGQARVREFLLVFELDLELRDGDDDVLIRRETLRLTREYSFDEQAILAASREEEFLRADLRRSMAAQVIRRLEAVPAR
ncbi:MAG: LPS assembly lipoprotein LptE [Wenzhouxiangella sp.]|jgi:LPS-assembly lipoprotein|nr:LPS assembly lipoprotein LptE [Wenzhouxiangella sp.]